MPLGVDERLRRVSDLRQNIACKRATHITERREQELMLAKVKKEMRELCAMADILIGAQVNGVQVAADVYTGDVETLEATARRHAAGLLPFHWCLEFPEAFDGRDGFDAFVGNPPFITGQKITGLLGRPYREFMVAAVANGQRGSADYCAYFFLRARVLLRPRGCLGLLATNTIAQGDTREVGLDTNCSGIARSFGPFRADHGPVNIVGGSSRVGMERRVVWASRAERRARVWHHANARHSRNSWW